MDESVTGITPPKATPLNAPAQSWWRRNTVALIALAVLVPATAVGIGWREWTTAHDNPTYRLSPVTAGDTGKVDLAGATWGPASSGVFTADDGFSIPDGSKIIAVKIAVNNDDDSTPVECLSPTLIEQSTGRQWAEMSTALDLAYDPDSPTSCKYDPEGPYEMLVPFIVPDDAEGPFWVRVVPNGSESDFVRFSIDP